MAKADRARSSATARDALRRALDEQVAGVRAADGALGPALGAGVHDMRIALRKLSSTLTVFAPMLAADTADLRPELRWFAGELGAVRDAEVLQARLTGASDDSVRRARKVLAAHLERSQREAVERAGAAWRSERYAELGESLGRLFGAQVVTPRADVPAAVGLTPLVLKEAERVAKRARRVRGGSADRDELTHELRKATKRARAVVSILDVGDAAVRESTTKLERALKKLQQSLGERQDSATARAYLDHLIEHGDLDSRGRKVVGRLVERGGGADLGGGPAVAQGRGDGREAHSPAQVSGLSVPAARA